MADKASARQRPLPHRPALASGEALEKALEPLAERRRDPIAGLLLRILLVHREHGGGVKAVLDRLAAAARSRANVRKHIPSTSLRTGLAEQVQSRWEARIVSIAPFVMLAIFRFSAIASLLSSDAQGEL